MVRSEDIPGPDKHLRFGHYTEQLSALLIGFPGVKSIVLHTHGANGEHPHLHVWWSGSAVTNQTIRNRLKAYHDTFKLLKSQNDWSFRNHESYETWAAYVQRNKTHKVLHGELPLPKDIIELIIPSPQTPSIPAPPPRIITKKLNAEERLINYCITHEGLKPNQWGTAHFEDEELRDKVLQNVEEIVVAKSNGRLNNTQIVQQVRNVLFTFADPDLRVGLTRSWTRDTRRFYSYYV